MAISFPHLLVIISSLIGIIGAAAYIRDTIRGKTKPNRVSWALWALAPLIGTGSALAAGADAWATFRVFQAGFIPLIILGASFVNKQSYWKLTFFDMLCGVCSLIAFVLWIGISSPVTAVVIAAIGDGFACVPTLRKAWRYPETENGLPFIAGLIGILLVIPSIPKWDIQNSAFQIYLLLANASLIFAVYRKKIFPPSHSISNSRE